MPKIYIKIKKRKAGSFTAKICKIEGSKGVLRDGRPVTKKGEKWYYEAK